VGERTDDVIKEFSERSHVTLVAWGAHGSLLDRGHLVSPLLTRPLCLGVTSHEQPRHPLYVASTVALVPFVFGTQDIYARTRSAQTEAPFGAGQT
jgi:hypothetical protein